MNIKQMIDENTINKYAYDCGTQCAEIAQAALKELEND